VIIENQLFTDQDLAPSFLNRFGVIDLKINRRDTQQKVYSVCQPILPITVTMHYAWQAGVRRPICSLFRPGGFLYEIWVIKSNYCGL